MPGDLTDFLLVVGALALAAVLGAIIGVYFARRSSRRPDRLDHGEGEALDHPSLARLPPEHASPQRSRAGGSGPATAQFPERHTGGTSWGAYAVPRQRGRRPLFGATPPPAPPEPAPARDARDDFVAGNGLDIPMTMTVTFHEATERKLSMGPLEASGQPDPILRLSPPEPIALPGPPAPRTPDESSSAALSAPTPSSSPLPPAPSPSSAFRRTLPPTKPPEPPARHRTETRLRKAGRATPPPPPAKTYTKPTQEPAALPAATPIIVPWRSVAAHHVPPATPSGPVSAGPLDAQTVQVSQPVVDSPALEVVRIAPPPPPPPPAPASAPLDAAVLEALDPVLPQNLPPESDWRDVQACLRIRLRPNANDPEPPYRTLQIVGIGIEDGRRVILASDGPLCETEAVAIDDIADSIDRETLIRIEDPWNWLKAREWRPDLPLSNAAPPQD